MSIVILIIGLLAVGVLLLTVTLVLGIPLSEVGGPPILAVAGLVLLAAVKAMK